MITRLYIELALKLQIGTSNSIGEKNKVDDLAMRGRGEI